MKTHLTCLCTCWDEGVEGIKEFDWQIVLILLKIAESCDMGLKIYSRQRIHMKNQALFSFKDKSKKKIKMSSAAIFVWHFMGYGKEFDWQTMFLLLL